MFQTPLYKTLRSGCTSISQTIAQVAWAIWIFELDLNWLDNLGNLNIMKKYSLSGS